MLTVKAKVALIEKTASNGLLAIGYGDHASGYRSRGDLMRNGLRIYAISWFDAVW